MTPVTRSYRSVESTEYAGRWAGRGNSAVVKFLRGGLVALIKPQFEVGKGDVGKGGIVRDDAKRAGAVNAVVAAARALGFDVKGVIASPVKGAEGNVEYLMYAETNTPAAPPATIPA